MSLYVKSKLCFDTKWTLLLTTEMGIGEADFVKVFLLCSRQRPVRLLQSNQSVTLILTLRLSHAAI